MSDALTISGNGLHPIVVNSNVGDPVEISKTVHFTNKTKNIPIQVTVRVPDYCDIPTEHGSLKTYNFIVQPLQSTDVVYKTLPDIIKTLSPDTHRTSIKISAIAMTGGPVLL